MNLHTVPFKSKLTCLLQVSILNAIRDSQFLRDSRTSYRESSCRFLQQPIIESTCREQITRNNTLSIDYKQRPFRIDDSRRNQDSRIETQQSIIESRFSTRFSILNSILDSQLDSRFSRGSRIECQLTFDWYCITKNLETGKLCSF